jgi:hypothetical protein
MEKDTHLVVISVVQILFFLFLVVTPFLLRWRGVPVIPGVQKKTSS